MQVDLFDLIRDFLSHWEVDYSFFNVQIGGKFEAYFTQI